MKVFWSEQIDAILDVGVPLESTGVHNWGLPREAALAALDRLLELGVAITGGDVYNYDGLRATLSYDNWYCDSSTDEQYQSYVGRCYRKAVEYISSYMPPRGDVLFALVPNPSKCISPCIEP